VTTPAGWYPDPDGSGGQRYFNGQSWTDHRAPAAAVEAPSLDAAAAATGSSGSNGKVIAGVIAAVVVAVIVGAIAVVMTLKTDVGDSTVTHKPFDASAETPVVPEKAATGVEAPTLEDQAGSVGQPVRDGNFEFVVTGIERAPLVADPGFPELQKTATGEFVFVKMEVTNVGTEPQTFFASFNTLSDGTTDFQADDEAWIYLGNTLADLNPGDSIDTSVVFDVPVGTDPESVELHDGPFSEGVTVGL
jgi:Domain of unknown function (DUF4352)/Protein of unknown function (DUF2510)